MFRKYSIVLCLLVSGLQKNTYAQNNSFWLSGQFEQFRKKIEMPQVMYDYELNCVYPDSSKTKLKGSIYKLENTFLDENIEFTTFKNNHYFYKADHVNKSIMLVDIDKIKSQSKHKKAFDDNTLAEKYLLADSIIIKYGKVQVQTLKDIVKIMIDYSPELAMRKSVLEYNTSKQMLENFTVVTDVIYESNVNNSGEDSFSRLTVEGTHFSKQFEQDKLNQDRFFILKNGKYILQKYKNYKLTLLN